MQTAAGSPGARLRRRRKLPDGKLRNLDNLLHCRLRPRYNKTFLNLGIRNYSDNNFPSRENALFVGLKFETLFRLFPSFLFIVFPSSNLCMSQKLLDAIKLLKILPYIGNHCLMENTLVKLYCNLLVTLTLGSFESK